MRAALWPSSREDHIAEIDAFFQRASHDILVLVGVRSVGPLGGFVEVSVRSHAEGCRPGAVAYLEGWWVDPDLRREGVGRSLVAAAEDWARMRGLTEMASDTELPNLASQAAHRSLGFREAGRIVCFRKEL